MSAIDKNNRESIEVILIILNSLNDERPVSIKSISKKYEYNRGILAITANRLKRSGLIIPLRGPKGGYILVKPFNNYKIKDILPLVPPTQKILKQAFKFLSDMKLGEFINSR